MKVDVKELTVHFDKKILEFDLDVFGENDNGILGGRLGLIYYFFNMYKIDRKEIYLVKIAELLERVFENCNNGKATISSELNFSDGLCGLGFILNELIKFNIIDETYEEQLNVINDLALDYTLKAIKNNNFDFFYGAVGSFFYLVEVKQFTYCNIIVKELAKIAPYHDYVYHNEHPDEYNRGINFGLAHGNTALFMVLINLAKQGLNNKELIKLIRKGVEKLVNYEKEVCMEGEDIKNYFPHNILIENGKEKVNRSVVLGWCNSELDIALMIQNYLEIERNPELELTSVKISRETLKRKTESNTGVYDHHFCHGSSGIAQLYHKLFIQTKMKIFEEGSNFWLNETATFLERERNETTTTAKLNFLYGWPAALLTLNEYTHATMGGWDKLFLI